MKHALIEATTERGPGRVGQVEDVEFDIAPPFHWADCQDYVTVGMFYENGRFSSPPTEAAPAVPIVTDVDRKQFRLGLLRSSLDEDRILEFIAAIEDPIARKEMEIEWQESKTFRRDSAFAEMLRKGYKLTRGNLDAIWQLMLSL